MVRWERLLAVTETFSFDTYEHFLIWKSGIFDIRQTYFMETLENTNKIIFFRIFQYFIYLV